MGNRFQKGTATWLAPWVLFAVSCSTPTAGERGPRVPELGWLVRHAEAAEGPVEQSLPKAARDLLREPLDAEAAVSVALLNNREVRAVFREVGVARGHWVQAGLLPNPVFEAELLPERNTQLELRLEYDLTDALLAPLRGRALAPDVEAARFRAAGIVIEVGARARSAFYSLEAALQRLAMAQQVLDALAAARDGARALLDAGNVAELELAGREAAYERARALVARLEFDVVRERERVQRLLGVHGEDTRWETVGALPPLPEGHEWPPHLENRVIRASLDLREMKHRLEGLSRRAGMTRTAGWIPDLSVDVHALQGNPKAMAGQAEGEAWRATR